MEIFHTDLCIGKCWGTWVQHRWNVLPSEKCKLMTRSSVQHWNVLCALRRVTWSADINMSALNPCGSALESFGMFRWWIGRGISSAIRRVGSEYNSILCDLTHVLTSPFNVHKPNTFYVPLVPNRLSPRAEYGLRRCKDVKLQNQCQAAVFSASKIIEFLDIPEAVSNSSSGEGFCVTTIVLLKYLFITLR